MQTNHENVYCFEKGQKEKDIIEELERIGKRYHINEIIPLSTRDISVAQWVRLKCKYGCKKYGTSWCCPPETPSPDETSALLAEYDKALLLCGKRRNSAFYMDNQRKRKVQVNGWKGTVALERRLFLAGYYKAFSLVSERCALCKECGYPNECKFPMDRRPSVESCSIDIFQTLRNIGKTFDIVKDVKAEYNCYSIILLE